MKMTKSQIDFYSLAIALISAYFLTLIFRMVFLAPPVQTEAQLEAPNKRGQYVYEIKADCFGRDNAAKRNGKPTLVRGPMLPQKIMAKDDTQFNAILQQQYAGCRYMTTKKPDIGG